MAQEQTHSEPCKNRSTVPHDGISPWVVVLLSPVLLLLVLPLLSTVVITAVTRVVVQVFWKIPGRQHFRVTGKRTVRPLQQRNFTHRLSMMDKTLFPTMIICLDYFYEEDLDVNILCRALSNILTDLPYLAGRWKGYLLWSRIECAADACVEVIEAETGYRLRDVHLHGNSPAMQRSTLYPTGFGAGDPWDLFRPVISWWSGGAPIMRVRVTKLAGGGTALGIAVSHTAMDGEAVVKLVEVWAKEARRLSSLPEETGDGDGKSEDNRQALGILNTRITDDLVAEGAQGLPGLTVGRLIHDYLNWQKQSVMFFLWYFVLGLSSKTFFFPDELLADTKAQVMRELASSADPDKPSFVSTNDVLSAMMWQAMRRATSWYPGQSMCVFIVSMRDRVIRQKLQGTKDADKFLFANGILQGRVAHADPPSASILELACLIRGSLQVMTPAKMLEQAGQIKPKNTLLGFFLGPAFTDLDYTRDVGFTTFSPLEGDNDFGTGPAYFYHLDTTPIVFLVHPNKGYDRNDGDRKGMYVTVMASKPTTRALSKHLAAFLPKAPATHTPAVGQQTG